jgi:hypothetical protein
MVSVRNLNLHTERKNVGEEISKVKTILFFLLLIHPTDKNLFIYMYK